MFILNFLSCGTEQ